ncbi:MAG: phage/plasmid primase, P4 family [Sphingomonadales bacterium]|nr:phage/plasmid primase, P4 family [Sphingomonadales bacterium]
MTDDSTTTRGDKPANEPSESGASAPLNIGSGTRTPTLGPLIEAGYQLIPLRDGQKIPRDKDWTRRPYRNEDQIGHMERGGNVGVRLRPTDLVIDVDPRNFGEGWEEVEPFDELVLSLGLDPTEWPRVETGSGGEHYYLSIPPGASVRNSLPEFPGIEFKSVGRQVVAPGSTHPETGRAYRWAANESDLWCAPPVPGALLDAIAKTAVTLSNGGGEYDAEEIAAMLEALDPEDFREHDRWFEVMCACHHASNGSARQEFIDCSTGDPEYAGHGDIIGARWDSLRPTGDRPLITYRSLHRLLLDAGRDDVIPRTAAEDDFDAGRADAVSDIVGQATDYGSATPLASDAPMTMALEMLKGKALLRSNSEWFRYDRQLNHYVAVPHERFTSWCWKWSDGRPYTDSSKAEPEVKRFVAGKHKIANIEEAARSLRQGPDHAPSWLNQAPEDPRADQLMVCANGLLHLPTRRLLAADERFFSVNGTPVHYNPDAPLPKRWMRFLEEIFPNEPDCIETLQEATGYFLTQDTSLQKIVLFVGPPRAGKGVYTRVLQSLIGEGNYTSPIARNLAGRFGLQPLIGKQLAVISDMRHGKNINSTGLVETLLTISGEDSVSVERKKIENWEGKLNTRFLIVSNEVLQLKDTSDALGSRMIVIVTRQSFLGREDKGLTDKLREELPGILNWALDGLDRLKSRGHFVQPRSCKAEVMQMHKLTSPVKWFLDTEVVKGPGHRVRKDRFWEAFISWTLDEGLHFSGRKEHFIKDLNSAGARFKQSRPREDGRRVAYLNGLDLKEDFSKKIHMDAIRDFADLEE